MWSKFHHDINRHKYHNIKYGYLNVGTNFKHLIPQIIGKDGRNFKDITRQSGVHYIWYNNTNDTLQFWGPTIEAVNFCMLLLLKHIHATYVNNS